MKANYLIRLGINSHKEIPLAVSVVLLINYFYLNLFFYKILNSFQVLIYQKQNNSQ